MRAGRSRARPAPPRAAAAARFAGGLAAIAIAYYAAGRASMALHYTGPVAAIWLPAGVGAAALYLAGLRHWPAVLIADVALTDLSLPLGIALGVTAGNVVSLTVIVVLLRRLHGRRAALDRLEQVAGMLAAIALGAVITATVAVLTMYAGGEVGTAGAAAIWRSWALAGAAGALIVLPLALAWRTGPSAAWRGRGAWEGALLLVALAVLSAVGLSGDHHLTYLVFPALICAALRFEQQGATLAVATTAVLAVAITAGEAGAFIERPLTSSTLSTQLYIVVAGIATLCIAAIVAESRRAALDLAESKRREGRRAAEERERIARDLHDSVSQSLFSSALHLRTAERALEREDVERGGTLETELGRAKQLTGAALADIRALVFELRPDALGEDGLVAALSKHAAAVGAREEIAIVVHGPSERLALSPAAEEQLYRLAQEALANVVKHARARAAAITVSRRDGTVAVEIRDDGRGFRPAVDVVDGFGLRSMRARAAELGGRLQIASAPRCGTIVRAEVPAR